MYHIHTFHAKTIKNITNFMFSLENIGFCESSACCHSSSSECSEVRILLSTGEGPAASAEGECCFGSAEGECCIGTAEGEYCIRYSLVCLDASLAKVLLLCTTTTHIAQKKQNKNIGENRVICIHTQAMTNKCISTSNDKQLHQHRTKS